MSNFYTNFHRRGSKMLLRGYYNGRRIKEEVWLKPYLFIPSKTDESKYKDLQGNSVTRIDFETTKKAMDFIQKYEGISNFKIFGHKSFEYVHINDEYPGQIDYDESLISIVSIDIETPTDQGFPDPYLAETEISNITLSKNGKIVVFGCNYYKPKNDNTEYVLCKNEKDLLQKFLFVWNHEKWAPDIVTGWNTERFDIPYIYNRIKNLFDEKEANKLSPWGKVEVRELVRGKSSARAGKDIENRTDLYYDIVGITSLDYLELYRKFSFTNQESYKLDHIANVVLGENKLDYSEYGSLYELYIKNYEKFVDYNIHDTVLVERMEDKLGLIKQVFALAYDAKVNFLDVMTTTKPWDIIIHNYLMSKNIVIPFKEKSEMFDNLVGGYVKDPQVGMHDWVVSFDLNSLYPHLIMQYNISPETFVGRYPGEVNIDKYLNEEWEYRDANYSYTANGCYYRRDKQGFLPELMQKMYDDRVIYKDKMIEAKKRYQETNDPEDEKLISRYHNLQLAKKIQLNSAYGALGNQYFRWFNFNHAEAITTSGQLAIRWIEKKINQYFNKLLKTEDVDYVIASDTDSIYVKMGSLVEKLDMDDDLKIVSALDAFCEEKIQAYINKSYQELSDMMNAHQQKMQMKRENIANKAIWKAKKMYIMNVWNSEGVQYKEPQLKIMGIEAVRSSTPAVCRNNIKKALSLIMNTDERTVMNFVKDFRKEFSTLSFEDIAFPRSVKFKYIREGRPGVYTLGQKSLPIQVRASLVYNKLIDDYNLGNKYEKILNGDKIKFAYLREPNPVTRHDDVIAAPSELPQQLDLDKYINHDMQFEKAFLDPLRSIFEVLKWDANDKQIATLEDLF
jgi:DNA polymerase elongation subunit (family B)